MWIMLLYVEKSEESADKLLKQVNEFSKIARQNFIITNYITTKTFKFYRNY